MAKIFHPLLALIASGTDREQAKYVEFLKEEEKILRTGILFLLTSLFIATPAIERRNRDDCQQCFNPSPECFADP